MIVMENTWGEQVALGTGFLVAGGMLATNLHVVERGDQGFVRPIGSERRFPIRVTVAVDTVHDLALIHVPELPGVPLPIGNSTTTAVGDEVFTLGNPQGLEGTFSQGIVSSLRPLGLDTLLQITAAISEGSSGGPVLNRQGEVIGVAVATWRNGQNLNFAVPSIHLQTLLGHSGHSSPPLAQGNAPRREGGDAADQPLVEEPCFSPWSDVDFCSSYRLQSADEALNRIYGDLLWLERERAQPDGFRRREVARHRSEQRAWIASRDERCRQRRASLEQLRTLGAQAAFLDCLASATEQRVETLKDELSGVFVTEPRLTNRLGGTYERANNSGTLSVTVVGEGVVEVMIVAYWGQENTYGPNLGEIDGAMMVRAGRGVFRKRWGGASDNECVLPMLFSGRRVTIDLEDAMLRDGGNCGFGFNVVASGVYTRQDSLHLPPAR